MSNAHKVGLLFGALMGGFHLLWSVLVFFGIAQAIYDFIFWAHMIHLAFVVGPFDINAAVVLILMTAVIGYVAGFIGAKVWSYLHR